MIQQRPLLPILLLLGLFPFQGNLSAAPAKSAITSKETKAIAKPPAANSSEIQARQFFDQIAGKWSGKGTSSGMDIQDLLTLSWTLDKRFLKFHFGAREGDSFTAEGYFWYNPQKASCEFYEFNNGEWPIRILSGSLQGNTLTLREKTEDRHVQLTIGKNADGTLSLEEAFVQEKGLTPFVNEIFNRVK